MSTNPQIGKPVSRLEGHLKVTGAAKYAGEYNVPNLLYGYVVNSKIAKGKIKSINTNAAKALEGVIEVFTHENHPKIATLDLKYADMDAPKGTVFKPLHDNEIKFHGQPIAVAIAESFELARYASTLVQVEYEEEPFATCLTDHLDRARDTKKGMANYIMKALPPKPTGDFEAAYENSFAKASGEFHHGTEHHNPIELFATTVVYEGEGKLTIYEKTQGTINSQMYVANVFGLRFKDVRVIAPFVGGGFGSALRPQYQLFFAALAALQLQRSVRVTMDRAQMFTNSYRPQTVQKTRFSADEKGKLTGLNHTAVAVTSQFEDYNEVVVNWSNMLYPAPNTLFEYKVVPLDVFTPGDMRAPGGATGLHPVEVTMDELAYKLNMDPLELRLRNYADENPMEKKPFTSKELKQCYQKAAEKFGWDKRNPQIGSMTRGNKLVGYGMASGMWDAMQMPARIEAIIDKNGKLVINSAVTDIGTGMYTVMAQVAADELGLPLEDVTVEYGDSKKPFSFIQGGSFGMASTAMGVVGTAKVLRKKLLQKAKHIQHSPLAHVNEEDVLFKDGNVCLKNDASKYVSFKQIIEANQGKPIKAAKMTLPQALKLKKYSRNAHSAAFVEVEIDKELRTITVTRAVTAVAIGTVLNPKTARSQILGGMIWGISKTLCEETILDERFGKYINTNLGEYHIPVHADIHNLDVIFADEKDDIINELGMKGAGEIGVVAMPPAIANAIYHATGKRVNKFPIHMDDLF